MAEQIGEASDVVTFFIENDGEEMPQIMRKDFAWCDAAELGEFFSYRPRFYSAKWIYHLL